MRVLIYSPLSLGFGGGGEHWILEVASRLARKGHKLTVVTTKYANEEVRLQSETKVLFSREVAVEEISCIKPAGRFLMMPSPSGFRTLAQQAAQADITYFLNTFALQEVQMLFVKMIGKKPVINAFHTTYSMKPSGRLYALYKEAFVNHLIKLFDAHHVVNTADKGYLDRLGTRNVFHIPNGVDTSVFRPRKGNQSSRFRIVFAGRLVYDKGIDLFLQTVDRLNCNSSVGKDLEFLVAGDGPWVTEIKAAERKFGNVEYLGYLSHSRLARTYAASNLFFLPSRREGFPLALIEAQSCGVPALASNVSGSGEVIVDNVTGIICDNDPVVFAKAIEKLHELWKAKPESYLRMCLAARDNAVTNFSWDKIINEIEFMMDYVMLNRS